MASSTSKISSSLPNSSTLEGRKRIANDTLDRTPAIIASTPTASSDSSFETESTCPPLLAHSPHPPSPVRVINSDSFTAARNIISSHHAARVAVLNLASDQLPAGGWLMSLTRTQEEALCYSSTLYSTLSESYYPWPNLGPGSVAGIYSPGVVVFKDDLDHNCVDLPETKRVVVGVITVAAPREPKLTEDGTAFAKESDIHDFRGKIRLILRMAAKDDRDTLVLGAMGCGAYLCPPKFVAREMKSVILESEFKGRFKTIVFAVYSSNNNGPSNFKIFSETYKDFVINGNEQGS